MSNKMVPVTTQQEVDFMKKTRSILENNSNSLGPVHSQRLYENQRPKQQSARYIQPTIIPDDPYASTMAMKKVMESLDGLFDDPVSNTQKTYSKINERTISNNIDYHSSWEVVVSLNENGTRKYEVKNNNREIFENIAFNVFEAAYATSKILNNGTSKRIINDLVELDEDFSLYRNELLKSKQHYNKSIKLNESAAAEHFSKQIKKAQSSVTAIQESIRDILKDM